MALLINIICISSNAQRIPRVKSNPVRSSIVRGATSAAGIRALQVQQMEIARRNAEYTRQLREMERRNQEFRRQSELRSKCIESAYLRANTPATNLRTYRPGKMK